MTDRPGPGKSAERPAFPLAYFFLTVPEDPEALFPGDELREEDVREDEELRPERETEPLFELEEELRPETEPDFEEVESDVRSPWKIR